MTENLNRIFATFLLNQKTSLDPKKRGKEKPVTDRQPKGSDDRLGNIKRFFFPLDDMMETEESPWVVGWCDGPR